MSRRKVSRPVLFLALILMLAVGALASVIGIVFQGFETDTSGWFNADVAQQVFRHPSGYTNGGYASGIASAAGSYHARLVVDPTQCLNDGGVGAPPHNDCYGPNTYFNEIRVSDVVTTSASNVITSATANFNAAQVGLAVWATDGTNSIFAPGTTIASITNSTTAVLTSNASESYSGATFRGFSLFNNNFVTQVDIYLDTTWAASNPDWRFDWDSALRDNQVNFLSDYAFNVGTQLSNDLTAGFWVSTSTNTNRGNTYPENPCPSPGVDGLGNVCRAPVKITTSGWYTFRHIFHIDPVTHNLSVEFQVLPLAGSPVVDTTIYGWQGHAQAPAGGVFSAYGWFANQEIPELAIDDSLLNTQPALYNPPDGSTLPGSSVTFQWTGYPGASAYWLDVGASAGGNTYAQSGSLSNSTLSYTVNDLPTDGSTVYATWYYNIGGSWQHSQYSYTAFNNVGSPGMITSPPNNSTLPGSTVTFQWTAGVGATNYWLDVGSAPGGNQYYQSGPLGNVSQVTVNGLPTDGSTVYVTLYSYVGGQWLNTQDTYTAFSSTKGVITSPPNNSTLPGSTVTFQWTAGAGATAYWLDLGNVAGGNQYYQSGNLNNVTQVTVNGLPTDGSTVYATLYSLIGGQWLNNQYTYTAYNSASGKAVMQSPTPGTVIVGNQATFTWSAGNGATAYWLDIGTTLGGNNIYQSGSLNTLSTTVYTLPQNNTTIYVTLWSYIGGQWLNNQYTYNSAMAFQGFETDTGDWLQMIGATQVIARVASGGGVLGLPSASGNYHAEVYNADDDYCGPGCGFGDSSYSYFGYASPPPYPGDFAQTISMYVNANWPLALYNGPGVWIDESCGHPAGNYGGEHNFRLTPTGSTVNISADGGGTFATVTTSGWYSFQITYEKGALPTDLVTSHMNVFDSNGNLVGTTMVVSNSPGGPLYSQDLKGPDYVWITVWPNGWDGDVLAIDNVRADLLN